MMRPDSLPLALALAAALACAAPARDAAGNPPRAAAAAAAAIGIDHTGDACRVDEDCVSITKFSPSCRHRDCSYPG
ncbi:MAG TPA: hypothetical protein PLX20_09295 [Rhodocyclaceae bacterium]|nr:hypothetical protein [Rhodocyclaceae bacterium]HMV52774.1 hypothetical protein [Rhodocyclaceae bacterium]HNB79321.1 hypothetical protein [Rhodocyclaceae bacterium]HNH13316.1 hypothetical protein [Rhodocyclaceae bacterium]